MDARWYTLLHAGNPGDIEYYLDACSGARSLLELGCGIGRITLPLVARGLDVTAVDISEEMVQGINAAAQRLPLKQQQRLTVVRADMRRFSVQKVFDRVIIPYNSLLCLLLDDDVTDCLTLSARHLAPGGKLIFDIYDVPEPTSDDEDPDEAYEHIATIDDGPFTAQVYEKSLHHTDPRRLDARYHYEIYDKTGSAVETFEYDIPQRCIYTPDIPNLLERAGLEVVSITGDFQNTPVTDDTLQVVVVARRRHPRA